MSKADYILIVANIYMARSCNERLANFIGLAGLLVGILFIFMGD